MEVVEVLRGVGAVARTQVLRERGLSKRQIANSVARGEVLRLRAGVLALPGAPEDFSAAVLNNGLLTCASAAGRYGLWLLNPPARPHLSCLHGHSRDYANHRQRTVPAHEYLPLVGIPDVLVHALQCLPPVEAAVLVECSIRRGDTVRPFLLERLRGDRNGRARAALNLVTGCAESAIEVVARILFRSAGFHVETQVPIPGVGRVDFLLEGFVVVEVDGAAYHSDRRALRRDLQRNNAAIIGGYLVLRYSYEDIMFNQEAVLEQVSAVLSGRVIR
ncbi:Very-short-patch-repair endonuclease [Arthrobacter subterraneus]|uniref:Very-short-patch-repair endonuclease n=1 Tax=Arthrobacter subterraneus TaxID=335973 RepID=A0A1G8GPD1_9MICC|nr:Very-short-patch-repair endonuclease [Arthrobacter subterraneus]